MTGISKIPENVGISKIPENVGISPEGNYVSNILQLTLVHPPPPYGFFLVAPKKVI